MAGALGKAQVLNKDLNALEQELGAAHRAGTADAFCLYLYGLILTDRRAFSAPRMLPAACSRVSHARRQCGAPRDCRERKADAQAALVASISAYPCNWSAWKVSPSQLPHPCLSVLLEP